MDMINTLGLVASAFTTFSFAPQVWRTARTKDVSGISFMTYLILTIGLFLWLVYGVMRMDIPLIVANSVMVILTGLVLIMKVVYEKPETALQK